MKLHIFALLAIVAMSSAAFAQDSTPQPAGPENGGVSGATIPVIHTPGPDTMGSQSGALPATGTANGTGTGTAAGVTGTGTTGTGTTYGMTVTRPIPESSIQPTLVLPRPPSASEVATDQAIRKQADDDVSAYAERVSDSCDGSFKARIDWTMVSPLETHRYSPADACGAALQAIDEACENPVAKERIAKTIKSVICTTGPHPSVELHGATLVYVIDWQSANPGERIYTWLATHL